MLPRDTSGLKNETGVWAIHGLPAIRILEKYMFIVHVHIHVRSEYVEAFKEAVADNAQNSINETGVARFDVLQQENDITRFVLVEIYKTEEDWAKHKETAHYLKWRDTVEAMMAEPRKGIRYRQVFPNVPGWD
jgi:quinol monooxygenase YgiN